MREAQNDITAVSHRRGRSRDAKVLDANCQALVYVYAREISNEANIAGVLTSDEARRIAVNVAKLWDLLEVG
jgi:hypothetical protein